MKKAFLLTALSFILASPTLAQSVDLIWQGETYTPPLYHGRTLWSEQSVVSFLAIPQGLGNPANLHYKWSKNGTVLGSLSGIGRNTLSFSNTLFPKPQRVKVEIVSSGENGESVLASASLTVTPATPMLLVYEDNPLYGFMFHKETGSAYQLTEQEITFRAFPFFFSGSDINYEWRTNTEGTENTNSVTYRAPEDTSGSSNISIKASHAEKFMQSANKSLLVQFGEQ